MKNGQRAARTAMTRREPLQGSRRPRDSLLLDAKGVSVTCVPCRVAWYAATPRRCDANSNSTPMDKGAAVVVSPHHHRHTGPTACHHGRGQSVLKGIVDQRPLPKPKNALSLTELVEAVESELQQPREPGYSLEKHIVLRELLEQYSGDWRELERFAFADRTQLYTRNLVATDHETYALILIVWNPGKYSPIHDHPCDGCWVKVIAGCANEVRYQIQDHKLVEVDNATFAHGVTYMHDDFGLHKMGNPSSSTDAVTLHLYSPPYPKCQIWFDEGDATKSSEARPCYFSEYGERVVK